jgi:hypothetical protein
MSIELDHVFILTTADAPEAERLIESGLMEGSPNRHPGQGTANRRFFFDNAFLELLWVTDPAEVRSDLVRRTGLWERWTRRQADACPFGIALRSTPETEKVAPFSVWEYRPPYLPAPLAIHMAGNSERVTEPLLFYMPFARRPDLNDPTRQQPREHPAGVRRISRLAVSIAGNAEPSAELLAAERQCEGLSFLPGDENRMEIGFDGETAGKSVDLRPALPLIWRW